MQDTTSPNLGEYPSSILNIHALETSSYEGRGQKDHYIICLYAFASSSPISWGFPNIKAPMYNPDVSC